MFFWLTGERPLTLWVPWWGVLLLVATALPWYVLVEAESRGFLRYTLLESRVLSGAGPRVFPDEDASLGSIEFLVITLLAFLPWALALPWALWRAFRRPWEDATARLWLLFALWAVFVVGLFTASPFKLPHHGLPAFPALALLVARVWDETIDATPGSARPRALLGPVLVLFALATIALVAAWSGVVRIPPDVLATLDGSARRLAATGQSAPGSPLDAWRPLLARGAVIFGIGPVPMAVAPWRQAAWSGQRRLFLLSAVDPARSVVRTLAPASVHLIARTGGRWLYSNLADPGTSVR